MVDVFSALLSKLINLDLVIAIGDWLQMLRWTQPGKIESPDSGAIRSGLVPKFK
jgi:hypothetical protein